MDNTSEIITSALLEAKTPTEGELAVKQIVSPKWLVGLDEAGRGPLAGPVSAGAVVLGDDFDPELLALLNDSKKLTEAKREILFPQIQKQCLYWGIGLASAQEIDQYNILQASFLAMRRALAQVWKRALQKSSHNEFPEFANEWKGLELDKFHLLIDGNHRVKYLPAEVQTPVIKGDGRVASIAAASILAKVYRDRIMVELDFEDSRYGYAKHKGYPTKDHVEAVKQFGYSVHHRQSFHVKSLSQTELPL